VASEGSKRRATDLPMMRLSASPCGIGPVGRAEEAATIFGSAVRVQVAVDLT